MRPLPQMPTGTPEMLAILLGSPAGPLPTWLRSSMRESANQFQCCQDNRGREWGPWGGQGWALQAGCLLHLAPARS